MATRHEEQIRRNRDEQLKARLQREVKAPAFEPLWRRLVEERDESDSYEDLKDSAKRMADIQREALADVSFYSGPRPGRANRGEAAEEAAPADDLSDYELSCARMYSEYLCIWAGKRPDVVGFRAFTLGGTIPTGDETDKDMQKLANVAILDGVRALALVHSPKHHSPGGPWLRYAANDQDEIERHEVRRNSVLDSLRKLSEKLAESYPWHPADAARWLLTGSLVKVPPVIGRADTDGEAITITVRPFVDARTVTSLYRRTQRRFRSGDNRAVSKRAQAVLLFVSERTSRRGERPGWGALLKAWNASHVGGAWAFKEGDRAGFMRAYERAHKALLGKAPPPAWG